MKLDEFANALIMQFSKIMNKYKAEQKLDSLILQNNIREYTNEFIKIINLINKISNDEKRRRYICGLRGPV